MSEAHPIGIGPIKINPADLTSVCPFIEDEKELIIIKINPIKSKIKPIDIRDSIFILKFVSYIHLQNDQIVLTSLHL